MGISPTTFDNILAAGFADKWNNSRIRSDPISRQLQKTHLSKRSLDASGALGLVLHYLNSTMGQKSLQQIFGLTPVVCSIYLKRGLEILQYTLRRLPYAKIQWPKAESTTPDIYQYYSSLIQRKYPLLQGAFGFVDGCHLPIQTAGDSAVQNAYYNGWVHSHFTSNVFTFAPTGILLHAIINAPGSYHDAAVARDLFQLLQRHTASGYWLLADTAFPKSGSLEERIRTPLKADFNRWPQDPITKARLLRTNSQLISARQAAEWGMRSLQGSFGRLKIPMSAGDHAGRRRILEICCRLHQVRVRCEGINQIKNVYEPVWREYGQEIYEEFANMMFKDIERCDRISRFYFHHVV